MPTPSIDNFSYQSFRPNYLAPSSGIFSNLIFEKFPEDGIKYFIESLSIKTYRQMAWPCTF